MRIEPNISKPKADIAQPFLANGGEMGERIRAYDWGSTSLGEVSGWSQSLRTVVRLALTTKHPLGIMWGKDHIGLYNDAYAELIGPEKHPAYLGTPARVVWKEAWDIIESQINIVLSGEGATWHVDQLIPLTRNGRLQDSYWTYSFSPIDDETTASGIGGVLVVCNESTAHVMAERRAAFQQKLETSLVNLTNPETVITVGNELLGKEIGADSVGFCELDPTGEFFESHRTWSAKGHQGLIGRYRVKDYGAALLDQYRAGRTVVVNAVTSHPFTLGELERAAYASISIGAFVCVPLIRDSTLFGLLYVISKTARQWSSNDIATAEDLAARTLSALERTRYVAALLESEARFQAVADSIDDMVWSTTPTGQHDYYNQRWYEFTGLKLASAELAEWYELCHPDDKANAKKAWQQSLDAGTLLNHESRLRHHSGGYRWVLCRATPVKDQAGKIVRWYVTCTDTHETVNARNVMEQSREELEKLVSVKTAELQASENQLRHAQKLEAIGQLTGGIAHDFNNMLAVILGSLSLLKRSLASSSNNAAGNPFEPSRALRHVDAAVDSAKRAAALIKRLLAFSRQQPLASEFIDANELIEGMSDMLRMTLGEEFTTETILTPGLWHIHVDRSQLENVILNIVVNARDATLDGKRLKIQTNNCVLDAAYLVRHHDVALGEYVMISVTDEGIGMDPEVSAKSFEPFFTTKEVGKGTGLGLSQVYGFVKQSGGDVDIQSALGVGTTVTLYLPRAERAEVNHQSADTETMIPSTDVAGVNCAMTPSAPSVEARHALILVVEDEPSVRQFVVDAVDVLGYRVLHASSAASALKLINEHPEITLLLSDIVMPDMNGRDLAMEAGRRRPDLKILLMTGYEKKNLLPADALDLSAEIIWKPFTIEQLDAKLKEMLRLTTASLDHNGL